MLDFSKGKCNLHIQKSNYKKCSHLTMKSLYFLFDQRVKRVSLSVHKTRSFPGDLHKYITTQHNTTNQRLTDQPGVCSQTPLQRYFCPQTHIKRIKNSETGTISSSHCVECVPLLQRVCRQEVSSSSSVSVWVNMVFKGLANISVSVQQTICEEWHPWEDQI